MRISLIKNIQPKIVFSLNAYLKMITLISKTNTECAWHGFVSHVDDVYKVEDIVVYPQFVAGATVDADEEKYTPWLLSHTDEEIASIRLQGHSHVNMGVSPSGTDEDYFDELTSQVNDYYIFIIQNKKGDYTLRFVDKQNNLVYDDLIYTVDYGNDTDEWYESIKPMLQKKQYTTAKGGLSDPLISSTQVRRVRTMSGKTTTKTYMKNGKRKKVNHGLK